MNAYASADSAYEHAQSIGMYIDDNLPDRIASLTRDDLRELRDEYRSHYTFRLHGKPPYGLRFGAWVRDRKATELTLEYGL